MDAFDFDDEKPCPDCHGSGVHECACGCSHQCGYCRGTGVVIMTRGDYSDLPLTAADAPAPGLERVGARVGVELGPKWGGMEDVL